MTKNLDGWTIVFDLDGTLVETAPDLLAALNHVLGRLELEPMPLDKVRGMIGHGAKAMIRAGLRSHEVEVDEASIDEHWGHFITHYTANISAESHPYEDCLAALDSLDSSGATLAVCTNKPQALSEQLLEELGMRTRFAAIVGADSVPDPKPHGDHILLTVQKAGGIPSRAIMVGDSETDEKAARNAGLPFIFVPFGYASGTTDDINAHAVVHHYSDLVSAISAITA